MDAGALELHLRRLPGVVACQLTAGEVVLLLAGGDPAAVRVAAQAALDQAGSDRTIRVLTPAALAAPVPVWRRRRFAVLAGAAGALSAGIAAASTLASMPGAVNPAGESAIAVPEVAETDDGRRAVRTEVPAPVRSAGADAGPATGEAADTDEGGGAGPVGPDAAASPSAPAAGAVSPSAAPAAPVPAPPAIPSPGPAPASPPASASPAAPASASPAPSGVVAAAADDDDDKKGQGRGRAGDHPDHPHGQPPGYLMRSGHGPW